MQNSQISKAYANAITQLADAQNVKLSDEITKFSELISSSNELENIGAELSSSMGSTIKFDYKVDQSLIGGLKLQLGSFMIDTSIKNKLKKYEQRMLEN